MGIMYFVRIILWREANILKYTLSQQQLWLRYQTQTYQSYLLLGQSFLHRPRYSEQVTLAANLHWESIFVTCPSLRAQTRPVSIKYNFKRKDLCKQVKIKSPKNWCGKKLYTRKRLEGGFFMNAMRKGRNRWKIKVTVFYHLVKIVIIFKVIILSNWEGRREKGLNLIFLPSIGGGSYLMARGVHDPSREIGVVLAAGPADEGVCEIDRVCLRLDENMVSHSNCELNLPRNAPQTVSFDWSAYPALL